MKNWFGDIFEDLFKETYKSTSQPSMQPDRYHRVRTADGNLIGTISANAMAQLLNTKRAHFRLNDSGSRYVKITDGGLTAGHTKTVRVFIWTGYYIETASYVDE
jgi:hypothetical protein